MPRRGPTGAKPAEANLHAEYFEATVELCLPPATLAGRSPTPGAPARAGFHGSFLEIFQSNSDAGPGNDDELFDGAETESADRVPRPTSWERLILAATLMFTTLSSAAQPVSDGSRVLPEDPPAVELPPASIPFVEFLTVAPMTNQPWSRPIPARVCLMTSARANVGAVVDGRVEEILVRPGDMVHAGAPLLRIYSAAGGLMRAEAQQAGARLQAAEETLGRFTNMLARGVATELELFEASLRAREARIEAERSRGANALLGDGAGSQLVVVAPTNGIVLSVDAAVGGALQPGQPLVGIGDPSRIWIEASLNEEEASRVGRGQVACVETFRGPERIRARVDSIEAQLDPVTRTRRMHVVPDGEAPPTLTLGALVEVRVAEPRDQLLLPVAAVLIKDGERRVVYVQGPDGKLRARDVEVAAAASGQVRVVRGLAVGERVVIKGALLVDERAAQLL